MRREREKKEARDRNKNEKKNNTKDGKDAPRLADVVGRRRSPLVAAVRVGTKKRPLIGRRRRRLFMPFHSIFRAEKEKERERENEREREREKDQLIGHVLSRCRPSRHLRANSCFLFFETPPNVESMKKKRNRKTR